MEDAESNPKLLTVPVMPPLTCDEIAQPTRLIVGDMLWL
jgi:hypothetical protein